MGRQLEPQGSIPQVLDKIVFYGPQRECRACQQVGGAHWHGCLIPELLTALRSLPPVPMQVIEELVTQWRGQATRWRADDETPVACEWADTLEICADELAAALRSLASPNSEKDQKDVTRVDR